MTDINKGEGNSISITYQIPSATLSEFDLNVPQTRAVANELKNYAKTDSLSAVATTGNYNDLMNTPDMSIYALATDVENLRQDVTLNSVFWTLGNDNDTIKLGHCYYIKDCDVTVKRIQWYNDRATTAIIHSTRPITFTSGEATFYCAAGMKDLVGSRYVYVIQWLPTDNKDMTTFFVNCNIYE